MYYSEKRLKKYSGNKKHYEFDKKLRILFLDFLEIIEINFRKKFLNFAENNNIDFLKKDIYREKYREKMINFFYKKFEKFEKTNIKFKNNLGKIDNFLLIENLTFGELTAVYTNLVAKNKKIISRKYEINPNLIENWIFISRYLRNICSHYSNLFNLKGKYKLESHKLLEIVKSNNSFIAYFSMLSIFEISLLGENNWQKKILSLINSYNMENEILYLNKKGLPSELKSEAWEEQYLELYSKYFKKSNLFYKKTKTVNKNFWQEQLKKYKKLCFLAPMDGYGDSAYRQTMRKIAPHICLISEFYSSDGLVMSKFLADSVLAHQKIEDPLVIQIFGKNPEMFAKAAKIISKEKYNIAGIDVNMGCPAKKVVRSGHGSSLMINEETSYEIIKALDEATKLPISVKTRLSFDGGQDLIKFGKNLEKAGCKLLTVHGRTAKQAYTGTANLKPIYKLQEELNIPVIANGDIMNFKDGMEKVKNLAGFMIGRGSFGNPWCFLGEQHNPENISNPEEKKLYSHLNPNNFVDGIYYPSLSEILDIMDFHAKALVETKGEKKGSLEIRKHLVQYLKHFPGVKVYRKRLVTTDSYENSKNIIQEIREEFRDFLERRPALGEITKEDLGIE